VRDRFQLGDLDGDFGSRRHRGHQHGFQLKQTKVPESE
jgi:hypothetical protein